MENAPKQLKRLISEWAAVAHDRELSTALEEVHGQFDRWKRGEITAGELNDLVHRFHNGASRELWKRYVDNRAEPAVALAIATGVLQRDELPTELVEHLAGLIGFYRGERSAT